MIPIASGRDEIAKDVLNDTWVSIPDGTESRKPKNNYEEDLFKVEDLRYYYDQTIKCNQFVIDLLENSVKEINQLSEKEKTQYILGPEYT